MSRPSRRRFVGGLGAAALAGATLGQGRTAVAGERKRPGKRIVPGSPYPAFSRAVGLDRLVWVSGVLGQVPGTRELASPEFEGQARQALENLKASVEAAGSSMDRVLKCTAFLTEQDDFSTFNEVYMKFFPGDPPARSTVIVKALVAPGAKIEIDCLAYVD